MFDLKPFFNSVYGRMGSPVLPQRFPPLGSFARDDISQSEIVAVTTKFATPAEFQEIKVPEGHRGVIAMLGLELNSNAGLPDITSRFQVNGRPYENYAAPPVLLGTIDQPSEIFIELTDGDEVELQFKNISTVQPWIVTWRLRWWTWVPGEYAPQARQGR